MSEKVELSADERRHYANMQGEWPPDRVRARGALGKAGTCGKSGASPNVAADVFCQRPSGHDGAHRWEGRGLWVEWWFESGPGPEVGRNCGCGSRETVEQAGAGLYCGGCGRPIDAIEELCAAVKDVLGTLNYYIGPNSRTAVSRESRARYQRLVAAVEIVEREVDRDA